MGIASWVIFGAIAGWMATRLLHGEGRGCLTNMVIGVGGAILGGAVYTLIRGEDFVFHFNLPSLIVAVVGAIALIAILDRLSPNA